MTKRHRPPPTKFGSAPPVQAKPGSAAGGRTHAPPPTRFGQQPAMQPKPAPAAGRTHAPPPTRYAGPQIAQAKAPPAAPAAVQMMQSSASSSGKRERKPNSRYAEFFTEEKMDEEIVTALRGLGDDRPLVEYVTDDGEDYAYVPPGSTEKPPYSRPGWRAGTYEAIAARQTIAGRLYCALCHDEIAIDNTGKEVWTSRSGKVHTTRPPIDHANPDWIVRIRMIKGKYNNKEGKDMDLIEFNTVRNEVVEAYHEPDLQIAHMVCNARKAKS